MTKLLLRSFMMLVVGMVMFSSCIKEKNVEPDPGLETSEAFGIDATSAKIKVDLSIAGNITIDEKGICWNTSPKPTTNHETDNAGSGNNSFTGNLKGLSPITKYYVRSYYRSGNTIKYGNEISFTTTNSPFVGEWNNQSGTVVYTGTSAGLKFKSVTSSTSNLNWGQALARGYISLGTEYIRNIQKNSNSYRCEALWYYGTSSQGVTGVAYSSNTTITFNAAGTEMYISSSSPIDGSYSSGTLYKK